MNPIYNNFAIMFTLFTKSEIITIINIKRQCIHLALYFQNKATFYLHSGQIILLFIGYIHLPLTCMVQFNPVQHSKYHGRWYPGSLGRQDISIHDIDYAEWISLWLWVFVTLKYELFSQWNLKYGR